MTSIRCHQKRGPVPTVHRPASGLPPGMPLRETCAVVSTEHAFTMVFSRVQVDRSAGTCSPARQIAQSARCRGNGQDDSGKLCQKAAHRKMHCGMTRPAAPVQGAGVAVCIRPRPPRRDERHTQWRQRRFRMARPGRRQHRSNRPRQHGDAGPMTLMTSPMTLPAAWPSPSGIGSHATAVGRSQVSQAPHRIQPLVGARMSSKPTGLTGARKDQRRQTRSGRQWLHTRAKRTEETAPVPQR